MVTKAQLLAKYRTAINRVHLAYASLVLWSHPEMPQFFEAMHEELPARLRPHPTVLGLVHNEGAMKIAIDQLYDSTYRAALTDLLALTKAYCHSTNQLNGLKAQPWFQLWSLLRNCFAHDMKFNFNAAERKSLPVSWNGVTIDASMNGKSLTHGQCSRAKIHELMEAAAAYIRSDVA